MTSKKAQMSARKLIYYIIFSFVSIITFLLIVWLVPSNQAHLAEFPPGIEGYVIAERFVSSPSCFVYTDPVTGNIKPGIIDASLFTAAQLQSCYVADGTNVNAYRLILEYGEEKRELTTKNWEGLLRRSQQQDVLVKTESDLIKGTLIIDTQHEN